MCSLAERAQLDTTALLSSLLPPPNAGRERDSEGRDLQAIRTSLGGLVTFPPTLCFAYPSPLLPYPIPFLRSRSLPGHAPREVLTHGKHYLELLRGFR